MIEPILHAIPGVLEPANLLAMLVGLVAGVVIGALPGLTATMGIAVLIPLTFGLDPLVALGMMAGIYNGAMYGGAIPAILLKIPGTPSAITTTFDGYAMAERGEAGRAMQIACLASVIGSVVSAISLLLLAPPLARFAIVFGPAEYFWIAIFGLSSVSLLFGKDPLKGLLAACIGLLLSTVGIDNVSGYERLTFGSLQLATGFNIVILLIGLYALPAVLDIAQQSLTRSLPPDVYKLKSNHGLFHEFPRFIPTYVRSSLIGVVIGIMPGAAGTVASFLSYNDAKRSTKNPDPPFGEGNPLGVAAAECANNADTAASLIPALTLGVPGSSVAAVIMGGLLVHGLQPGPALFRDHPDVVYGFMIQMLLTSILLIFVGGMAATRLFAQVMRIPKAIMAPMIVVLCVVGGYCINNSMFDLYAMFAFGMVGYLMQRLEIPAAPAVLGVILGPMAEENFRLTMILSQNSPAALISQPISQIIVGLTLLVALYPLAARLLASMRRREASA